MKSKQLLHVVASTALTLGLAVTLNSCDIENLTQSLTEGTTENYTISNMASGTLNVNDNADIMASYELKDCPYAQLIEFLPDGHYRILSHDYVNSGVRQRVMRMQVDNMEVSIPMPAYESTATRLDNYPKNSGTYTYDREKDEFVLSDINWVVAADLLVVKEGTSIETYTCTKEPKVTDEELTRRLCHSWKLDEVLMKLYNMNSGKAKLVYTYRLSEEDRRDYCVYQIDFTNTGHFHRYLYNDENNGNGDWRWNNIMQQNLHYDFRYLSFDNPQPVGGSNDPTVYFADNYFYMTEEVEALAEDMDNPNGETIRLKAVLLYRFDAIAVPNK